MSTWFILAGSAAVVVLMIAAAAALGFRQRARLDEAEISRFAAAEGLNVEQAAIGEGARSAVARLSGGKILVVRVMGDGLSARVAPASATRIGLRGARVRIEFADVGFPPLNLQFNDAPPAWLADLAQGAAR